MTIRDFLRRHEQVQLSIRVDDLALRVVGVEFDDPAEAVRLVRFLVEVEAFLEAAPGEDRALDARSTEILRVDSFPND